MVKKIRFDLKLSGRNVGTLEELRENFELERIFQYYNDGKLEKWLKLRNYNEEAQKVAAIDGKTAKDNKKRTLCEIFAVSYTIKSVVSTQEELNKIVNSDDKQIVYLYGNKFDIDAQFENKTYYFMNKYDVQVNIECSDIEKSNIIDIENELKKRNIKFYGGDRVSLGFRSGGILTKQFTI